MNVYLDGEDLGPLSTGLFKDQQTGEHRIELKGDGLYWEGSVIIEEGKTVTVEAYPKPFGTLSFELPKGASAVLKGRVSKTTIRGKDEINLSEGDYKVSVSGENYQRFETEISIKRGKTLSFKPELAFSDEYIAQIEANKKTAVYNELDDMISSLEAAVKDEEGDIKTELYSARECYKKIKDSGYDFPELSGRAEIVLKDAIDNRIAELDSMIEGTGTEGGVNGINIGKWVAFGAGAAGLALSGVTLFMGNSEYETYKTAVTSDAALESHNKLEMYTILQIVGYSVAGAGAVTGTVLHFFGDSIYISRWEAERFDLTAEKAQIEGGM